MSAKNNKRIATCWTPRVMDMNAEEVEIIFDGKNTAGGNQRVSVRLSKWELPGMIKEFARIAKNKVTTAVSFQQQLKDAVQ